VKNQTVLFVDCCPSAKAFELLAGNGNTVIVLDHHITAKDRMETYELSYFNMDMSGASIAWQYFFPEEEMPYFVRMIEDRDLWRKQIEDTDNFFMWYLF